MFGRITYTRARALMVLAGLVVLLGIALVQRLRGVDNVEVGTTLLFVPVFFAWVLWKIPGGVIAGILATLGYVLLRQPAIDQVGIDPIMGLIVSRGIAFISFGALGGWANAQLERSLEKLELYDQIDDATGLYNARFFVEDTDLEMSRAGRYQTIFSVVTVEIPAEPMRRLSRRKRAAVLRDLGGKLKDAGRTVDRPAHGFDGTKHVLAFVLPETGPEGAHIFATRLAEVVAGALGAGVEPASLDPKTITFPGDDAALEELRAKFADLDRFEHPQPAATGS